VQWTLLDGINDTADETEGLVRLLTGKHAVLNLIPYNAVDGLSLARPAAERSMAMARELLRRGVLTKLRRSAGQDVQAGCGQLRARHAGDDKPHIEIVDRSGPRQKTTCADALRTARARL
jgi:23S rRNA (adenine2503-C2)-methyltransferase